MSVPVLGELISGTGNPILAASLVKGTRSTRVQWISSQGNDNNSGTTPLQAVATLAQALTNLGTSTSGVIRSNEPLFFTLSTALILPSNVALDMPLSTFVGQVTVRSRYFYAGGILGNLTIDNSLPVWVGTVVSGSVTLTTSSKAVGPGVYGLDGSNKLGNHPLGDSTSLRGRAIATAVPTNRQAYLWNSTTSAWTPGSVDATLQGRAIDTTAPTDGQILTWDETNLIWRPTTATAADAHGRAKITYRFSLTVPAGAVSLHLPQTDSQNRVVNLNANYPLAVKRDGQLLPTNQYQINYTTNSVVILQAALTPGSATFEVDTELSFLDIPIVEFGAAAPFNSFIAMSRTADVASRPSSPRTGAIIYQDDIAAMLFRNTNAWQRMDDARQIQGRNIASTAPTTGQYLAWSGTQWAPASDKARVRTVSYTYIGDGIKSTFSGPDDDGRVMLLPAVGDIAVTDNGVALPTGDFTINRSASSITVVNPPDDAEELTITVDSDEVTAEYNGIAPARTYLPLPVATSSDAFPGPIGAFRYESDIRALAFKYGTTDAQKLLLRAIVPPAPNILTGADLRVAPWYNFETTPSDGTYVLDMWRYVQGSTGGQVTVSQNTGISANFNVASDPATRRFGFFQMIDGGQTRSLIGQVLSVAARAQAVGTGQTMNVRVLSWAGNYDAPDSDPVQAWNSGATLPTFKADWTDLGGTLGTLGATFSTLSKDGGITVPSGANNIGVLVWFDIDSPSNAIDVDVAWVGLTATSTWNGIVDESLGEAEIDVARYFFEIEGESVGRWIGIGRAISTTQAEFVLQYPVRMARKADLSFSAASHFLVNDNVATALADSYNGRETARIVVTTSGLTAGQAVSLRFSTTAPITSYIRIDARL